MRLNLMDAHYLVSSEDPIRKSINSSTNSSFLKINNKIVNDNLRHLTEKILNESGKAALATLHENWAFDSADKCNQNVEQDPSMPNFYSLFMFFK